MARMFRVEPDQRVEAVLVVEHAWRLTLSARTAVVAANRGHARVQSLAGEQSRVCLPAWTCAFSVAGCGAGVHAVSTVSGAKRAVAGRAVLQDGERRALPDFRFWQVRLVLRHGDETSSVSAASASGSVPFG